MLNHITYEKVEEVIRLAERADSRPGERADLPRRGGREGDEGVSRPCPPAGPHPARDWPQAFTRYLEALSAPALAELVGLYRFGRGEFDQPELAVATTLRHPEPEAEWVAYLSSREDLAACLRGALRRR